ncbi:helix-turn-helix transcriptional regulator [Rhizobium sp. YTU87027]|uniref:helix-turn-helix transcriptional regulator n=1 Tax=Rhizobium sp. YTU87027 TaxID=3417741 RepID=UPI003D68D8F6
MDYEFIASIYEAAAIPDLWKGRGLLDQLALRSHCKDGVLMGMPPGGELRWIGNDSAVPKMEVYVSENWIARNPYLLNEERVRKFSEPRFLMDTEVMSVEEMMESDYYQGFMRRYGCFWHTGTSISSPSGDIIKLSVHRSFEEGPLPSEVTGRLTELRPHLARAALLASRLKFEQIKSTVDALESLGIWAGALRNGKLIVANSGFSRLIPEVIRDSRHRLVFAQRTTEARWQALIEGGVVKLGGSFPIAADEQHPAMVVHALPIAGEAHDIFAAADLLLVITPAIREAKVDDGLLAGLFDLTPAEASVAREIGLGQSVEVVAKARNVSVGTVRAQLHTVFEKTGTSGQIDLARLVVGLGK